MNRYAKRSEPIQPSMRGMISQKRLQELLRYDPETGSFTWLMRSSKSVRVGDLAGYVDAGGYCSIRVDGHQHRVHRLAWLYMTGHWPREVDHINGEKADNRWRNLREVTHRVNAQNLRGAHRNNRLGLLGVWEASGKFRACIRIDGKKRHLGRFTTPEAAHAAYIAAKKRLHAGCTI